MDIKYIDKLIGEFENSEESLSNIRTLSSLYIVREYCEKKSDIVEQELDDILPQYRTYCEVKRKYQMRELSEQAVFTAMNNLCRELSEFVHILYSSTDTETERKILTETINELYRTL